MCTNESQFRVVLDKYEQLIIAYETRRVQVENLSHEVLKIKSEVSQERANNAQKFIAVGGFAKECLRIFNTNPKELSNEDFSLMESLKKRATVYVENAETLRAFHEEGNQD